MFADNPTATWGQGWHGPATQENNSHENNSYNNTKPSSQIHSQQKLNKKLLQQLNKQQQQQAGFQEVSQQAGPAAVADRDEWLQDSAAAAAAAAAAGSRGGDLTKSQSVQGAGKPSNAAAAAVSAAASVVGPDVDLVLPLHASAFGYRPTMSAFRRKRVMMQQVRVCECGWVGCQETELLVCSSEALLLIRDND